VIAQFNFGQFRNNLYCY